MLRNMHTLPHLPCMQGPDPKTKKKKKREILPSHHSFDSSASRIEAPNRASPGSRNHQDPGRGAVDRIRECVRVSRIGDSRMLGKRALIPLWLSGMIMG